MTQNMRLCIVAALLTALSAGCVERQLTIVTEPSDAVVWLNDEEVGTTPVTVNFNWYGDYNVRIEKDGYAIVNTHRLLERPAHDKFPLDFVAEVLTPERIVDEYLWSFTLDPFEPAPSEELVRAADAMRRRADAELGQVATEILNESD
jgi:hypothetical protein